MNIPRLNDVSGFIRNLKASKIANAAKVLSSYHVSQLLDAPKHWGYPFMLSVEPTTSCNLRCPECPSGLRSFTRDTGMIDLPLLQKAVDELENYLMFLYLYFQGEPYLHPRFCELVDYASKKNIYTVTSTNAHFLDDENARKTVESGLSRLIISVDGTTQESYRKYRVGGSLETVLEGTKNLVNWKKKLKSSTPHTVFQMVIFSHNENEIGTLHHLADECGVDEVKLKSAQIYDFERGSGLIPVNQKYSRYALNVGHPERSRRVEQVPVLNSFYQIKNPLLNHCWKMWHSCVMSWDGKIVPCCFDKDATHVMGDLSKQSFAEIWNNEPYREFRRKILRSRKEIDICSNCSEGTKVWV